MGNASFIGLPLLGYACWGRSPIDRLIAFRYMSHENHRQCRDNRQNNDPKPFTTHHRHSPCSVVCVDKPTIKKRTPTRRPSVHRRKKIYPGESEDRRNDDKDETRTRATFVTRKLIC